MLLRYNSQKYILKKILAHDLIMSWMVNIFEYNEGVIAPCNTLR